MRNNLNDSVLKELCEEGVWRISDVMKSVLQYQISRLDKRKVNEDETRYPKSQAGMRSFLKKFFTRHYLQAQSSLVDYMSSNDFIDIIKNESLTILDIGSGPAVTSLAITDMLTYIIEHLQDIGEWSKGRVVKINYIMNDTSEIYLGTGQYMIKDYFRRKHIKEIDYSHIFSIQKGFPNNINQLRRIRNNLGIYDIVIFSYVLSPLIEDKIYSQLINGFMEIENLCNQRGRILILQDKFQKNLMQRISRSIGVSSHREESHQYIYPKRNDNDTYKYTYYSCLYKPKKKINESLKIVA